MCGIFSLLNTKKQRLEVLQMLTLARKSMHHRGPDNSDYVLSGDCVFAHNRLSIVDAKTGKQPFDIDDIILVANGEIYNHEQLWSEHIEHPRTTHSDCEILLRLFQKYKFDMLEKADVRGMYGFVVYDKKTGEWAIGRDHMGIIPLYYYDGGDSGFYVASEIKALTHLQLTDSERQKIRQVPINSLICYAGKIKTKSYALPYRLPHTCLDIRKNLEEAVKAHTMCDTKYGVLLSGGVDSSIIAAILARMSPGEKIHSFCIGLEGSPDLENAEKVAKFIGTEHHSFTFTIEEGLNALPEVVYAIETYDLTTIRASTPMYLLAKRIHEYDPEIRVIFSGEGADEIFGGYLYFHHAPNEEEMQRELIDKVSDLHNFDCLRANKAMMAHSIEVRPPFLDKYFMEYAMNIDPKYKMIRDGRMEKHILRDAFKGYIPDEVLWRRKEQFSDGVGYKWIDSLKQYADEYTRTVDKSFVINPPLSSEAFLYRSLYESYFGKMLYACKYLQTVACGTNKSMLWCEDFKKSADPSGRSVSVHQAYSVHKK